MRHGALPKKATPRTDGGGRTRITRMHSPVRRPRWNGTCEVARGLRSRSQIAHEEQLAGVVRERRLARAEPLRDPLLRSPGRVSAHLASDVAQPHHRRPCASPVVTVADGMTKRESGSSYIHRMQSKLLAALCGLFLAACTNDAADGELDRTRLPIKEPESPKSTVLDARNAKAPPRFEVKVPQGAPNVIIVLIDDMGFGQPSPFGGPVRMPAAERLVGDRVRPA